MAPNLIVKTAFVRGDYDSGNILRDDKSLVLDEQKSIRTDFVLQNIFAHVIGCNYSFQAIPATNISEEKLIVVIKEIVDSFKQLNYHDMQILCMQIEFTRDTLNSILQQVANELFCEGITWSRIVALIAYVGELTLQSIAKNISDDIIDVMYECFCRIVKENLSGWVEDHGGWGGMRCLSQADSKQLQSANAGWAKSLMHNTLRMLGTLAQIANTTGQAFS